MERISRWEFLFDHSDLLDFYLCKSCAMIGAVAPEPGGDGLMAGVFTWGTTGPMGQRSMGLIPRPPEANVCQVMSKYLVQIIIPLY